MASKMYNTPNAQSYIAAADLSAKQYTFVKFHTVLGEVAAVSSAADIPCGILMNTPTEGQAAEVAMPGGGALLTVDANIINGSFISTGADGKGELATSSSGKYIGAIADAVSSSASSANDVFPVNVVAFEAAREAQDIMTTQGDLIRGGTAGAPERVALGATGNVVASDGTDAVWGFVAAAQCNVTAGTVEASKPVVLDASKQQDEVDVTDTVKFNGVDVPVKCSFTPASAASNVSEITIQVQDAAGTSLVAGPYTLQVFLSDAATGLGLTSTSASGTVQVKSASGTDFEAQLAKKALVVQTLVDGTYVLEITDSSKTGFYVASVPFGSGQTSVSAQLVSGDYGA